MKKQFTKTKLMEHQLKAVRKAWGRVAFAYLMEQGTGKSLTLLAESLALYDRGEIEGLFVLAPNGVHINWVIDQIPQHVPDNIECRAAYVASDLNKREKAAIEGVLDPTFKGFRILTASYDTLLVLDNFKLCERFVRAYRCMGAADESHKIKNKSASRTKRALVLKKHMPIRRIMTGTLIGDSPVDAFSQFEFLGEGLIGETSITAFRANYCELLPQGHGVLRHIIERRERTLGRKMSEKEKAAFMPQIVAQDELGRPRYKNLDRLQAIVAEHSFRVLKADCLDLPPKVFETLYFHLTKKQRAVYDRLERELRFELEDGNTLTMSKLVALGKLRQITSGFLLMRDGTTVYLEDNPRIELLHDNTEGETQQGLIWSQYKEEQAAIDRMFKKQQVTSAIINGDVVRKRRQETIDEFKAGNIQWLNAHPETIGTGYTINEAKIAYFFSNGFKMIERVQAEDRNNRIGTTGDQSLYRDLVAIDTRDDNVVWALQHKLDIAATINGDPRGKSRFAPMKG